MNDLELNGEIHTSIGRDESKMLFKRNKLNILKISKRTNRENMLNRSYNLTAVCRLYTHDRQFFILIFNL